MMLADANGPGVGSDFESPIGEVSSPTPEATQTATPTATVSAVPTTDPIVSPDTGGTSWLIWLILAVAIIGGIITLVLRNRK